jgi:thiosulfate/3-mercaptopyruvate sulfurtransferase
MPDRTSPLVSAAWLAEHLDDPGVVVADVRWYLQGKRARDEYARGHIPGAAFVDLDRELASSPAPGRPGRHPLPDAATVSALLSRLGAGLGTVVVAYDDAGGSIAARLWWLLRYFGHGGGRVLDGGIQAWTKAGHPLETAERARPAAPAPLLGPQRAMAVGKREVRDLLGRPDAVLLDARVAERFRGDLEPIDARPGHIPGARNAPHPGNLVEPGGVFRSPEELRARYAGLGVADGKKVVAYCGSGVTACHTLLALAVTGRDDALLYEGSWSDWSADPALPAATGET